MSNVFVTRQHPYPYDSEEEVLIERTSPRKGGLLAEGNFSIPAKSQKGIRFVPENVCVFSGVIFGEECSDALYLRDMVINRTVSLLKFPVRCHWLDERAPDSRLLFLFPGQLLEFYLENSTDKTRTCQVRAWGYELNLETCNVVSASRFAGQEIPEDEFARIFRAPLKAQALDAT